MALDADSLVQDVLDAYNEYAPTATELAAWNVATPFAADGTLDTALGLFGADLTDFTAACLASTLCAKEDFAAWNGWAVGVQWTNSADATANDFNGLIIEDLLWGVMVGWSFVSTLRRELKATTVNVLYAATVDAVAEDAPASSDDVTDDVVDNAFEGWSGLPLTNLKSQAMFSFLDGTDADQSEIQAGSLVSVWTTESIWGGSANVNTAAFELVGAVQMTVAATSAIALALLF
jgi:hypothetical protein